MTRSDGSNGPKKRPIAPTTMSTAARESAPACDEASGVVLSDRRAVCARCVRPKANGSVPDGNDSDGDTGTVRAVADGADCASNSSSATTVEADAVQQVLHNCDLFHTIVGFFVSVERCQYDGRALRKCRAVSCRWRNSIRSPTTWKALRTANAQFIHGESDIAWLFRLRDVSTDDGKPASLTPFTLLRALPSQTHHVASDDTTDESRVFVVQDQSTSHRYRIDIASTSVLSSRILREISDDHFRLRERFLPRAPSVDASPDAPFNAARIHDLPRQLQQLQTPKQSSLLCGICTYNGRIVRWYSASSDDELLTAHNLDETVEQGLSSRVDTSSPAPIMTLTAAPVSNIVSDDNDDDGIDTLLDHLDDLLSMEQLEERRWSNFQQSSVVTSPDYAQCWAPLVDWIAEICECFQLDDRLPFHAMFLFHRFIARCPNTVAKCRYQLIAGGCVYIAAKMLSQQINEQDIAYSADRTFAPSHILHASRIILQQVNWEIAFPTISDFLRQYIKILKMQKRTCAYSMMMYLSELALQAMVPTTCSYSQIAASIVVLARYITRSADLWPDRLQHATEYALSDLSESTTMLCSRITQIGDEHPDLIIIERRYPSSQRGGLERRILRQMPAFSALVEFHEQSKRGIVPV